MDLPKRDRVTHTKLYRCVRVCQVRAFNIGVLLTTSKSELQAIDYTTASRTETPPERLNDPTTLNGCGSCPIAQLHTLQVLSTQSHGIVHLVTQQIQKIAVITRHQSLPIISDNIGCGIGPDNLDRAPEPIPALPRIEQGDDERESTSDSRGVIHCLSRHRHSNNQVSSSQNGPREDCLRKGEAEYDNEARNVGTCDRHENSSKLVWHFERSKLDILAFAQQVREYGGQIRSRRENNE